MNTDIQAADHTDHGQQLAAGTTTALTIAGGQTGFTDQQIAALKQLGIDDAPRGDIDMFFHQAKRTGLDPFAKQIYMIGRKTKVGGYRGEPERWETKYTIQVGIDGFRLVGQRIADAQGLERPVPSRQFCGPAGVWSEMWLGDGPPAAAKGIITIGTLRYESVVLFREYAQTKKTNGGEVMLTGQWSTKPATMLGKCAEAAAWRAAFPADFSSLYEAAEMDRHQVIDADVETPKRRTPGRGMAGLRAAVADAPAVEAVPEPAAAPAGVSKEQRQELVDLMAKEPGLDAADAALSWLSENLGRPVASTKELTADEATQVIDFLRAEQAKDQENAQ